MLKKTYFFGKKSCKNRFSVGGSSLEPRLPPTAGGFATRPPRCYSRLLLHSSVTRGLSQRQGRSQPGAREAKPPLKINLPPSPLTKSSKKKKTLKIKLKRQSTDITHAFDAAGCSVL